MRSRGIWLAVAFSLFMIPVGSGFCFGGGDIWRIEGIPSAVKQGDVFRLIVTVDGKGIPSGDFQGKGIFFHSRENGRDWEALVGVDVECAAGTYPLKITLVKGSWASKRMFEIEVARAFFGVQRINLPPEMVDLDPQSLERVMEEKKRIGALWAVRSEGQRWNGDFSPPVEGRISTFFGTRRILNGQRRGRHNGIDIKALQGERVLSPNDGRVILVDEFFFGGKTVIIDHGQGLYSFYMHLDQIAVPLNRNVRKGDFIGTVGATGRATGPHLHWGVCLNGARVDPLSLMEAATDDKEAIQTVRNRKYIAEKGKKGSKNGENIGKGGETLD